MARFKCYECGAEFDTPQAVQEDRGEFWGMPCNETVYYCPVCGGDFNELETVNEYNKHEEGGAHG